MHMSPGVSSRSTLSFGGAGIILATLIPLVAEAVGLFPVPYDFSWLNQFGQPSFAQLCAGVLVVAFTILAMGIRKEPGIAGASVIGKLSLILFAVAGLAVRVIVPASIAPIGTISPNVLTVLSAVLLCTWLLGLAALIVASIVVFRAGVVRGVARWGLIVLAIATAITFALGLVPSVEVAEVTWWTYAVALLIQLLTGVLYVLHGQTAVLKHQLQVIHEPW